MASHTVGAYSWLPQARLIYTHPRGKYHSRVLFVFKRSLSTSDAFLSHVRPCWFFSLQNSGADGWGVSRLGGRVVLKWKLNEMKDMRLSDRRRHSGDSFPHA